MNRMAICAAALALPLGGCGVGLATADMLGMSEASFPDLTILTSDTLGISRDEIARSWDLDVDGGRAAWKAELNDGSRYQCDSTNTGMSARCLPMSG